jgi:hypothetical protein
MWMRACRLFDVAYVREPLIHLDQSPTVERTFDWRHAETLRTIQRLNTERMYGDSQDRLERELTRHVREFRRYYLRNVVRLAGRGQAAQAAAGLRLLAGIS